LTTNRMTIRIGGAAGDGVESSGVGFCKAVARGGLHVFGLPDYYSRIRGGHNFYSVRIGEDPLYSHEEQVHLLLALTEESIPRHLDHIAEGGANVSENRLRYVGQDSQATHGSGVVDHIAFHATGLSEMIDRLTKQGVEFKERQVDVQGLYQLFLHDPNGVKIELNYAAAEAKGRRATLMATDLPAEPANA
jgi:Pyruvate/2-oxoacid:ferredoxin oxidoreductase gamma subunit